MSATQRSNQAKMIIFLLFLLCSCSAHENKGPPLVKSKVGDIIGRYHHLEVFGRKYVIEKYLGIPFAEPPIGDLRFRKPGPAKPFVTPFQAFENRNACYQMKLLPILKDDVSLSEDCLFLNVYVPTDRNEMLAVMIWIHGGGFVGGDLQPYVSDTLAAHGNVVIVTINYRLSLWGFLSTGDEHAPGNYGLFDQHLAIKWVHDNIREFGGDPSRVTIFGESAGAASVVYQSTYEANAGLFQRAIAQSASVNVFWASYEGARQDTEILGELVGCEDKTSESLVKCLREVSADTLYSLRKIPSNNFIQFPSRFRPVIDGEFVKTSPGHWFDTRPVIPGALTESLEFFSSLDFLTGFTSREGGIVIGQLVGIEDPNNFEPTRTFFEETLLPKALSYVFGKDVPPIVKDIIIHQYTDWGCPDCVENIRYKVVQLYSEIMFTIPVLETIRHHASNSKPSKRTYMYTFDIKPSETFLRTPQWMKHANHADELCFLFFDENGGIVRHLHGRKSFKPAVWESDTAEYMITMWSNFAKTGNPNHPVPVRMFWPEYNNKTQQYLHITRNMTSQSVKDYLLAAEYNLWHNVIPAIYKGFLQEKRKT